MSNKYQSNDTHEKKIKKPAKQNVNEWNINFFLKEKAKK